MRSIRSPGKKAKILEAIADGLTLTEAAASAGICRTALFDWRQDDAEFAAEFEKAYRLGNDALEQEARRRAFDGSDILLIFLLKARDPHRFNRKMIGVGQDEQAPPVTTNVAMIYPKEGRSKG